MKEMVVDVFFKMEEESPLFDLQTDQVPAIWDSFRMYIYLKYYFPETNSIPIEKKNVSSELLLITKNLILSSYYFMSKKGTNFIFPCSRYQDSSGFYYDKASMNAIETLGGHGFIFELQSMQRSYRYKSVNNYIFIFKKFFNTKKNLPQNIYSVIEKTLTDYFGECKVAYADLNEIYKNYIFDFKYYKFIFKFKKTKRVFINQNGLQKGLIAAAKSLNATVYEFQHGSFNRDHLGYSYPELINVKSNIIFPDHLITFSKYWGTKFNVPTKSLIPLGNDYFFNEPFEVTSDESILIISSIIHGMELCQLANEIAEIFPNRIVNFKLHSNEYTSEDDYRKFLSSYPNIKIIKNEIDIPQLAALSDLVILINSTVLYEVLNLSKKVAIFKRQNYYGQHDVFNFSNVYTFDLATELKSIIANVAVETKNIFFDSFKRDLFLKIPQN
ncbi:MAG: hypothetical protein PHF81_05785 [Flavobacterium sp.]|nr:hypothetical protein [Flavobacterium sp.]